MVDSLQLFEILKAGSISETEARAMTLAIKQAEASSVSELKAFIEQAFTASDSKIAARFAAAEAKTEARFAASAAAIDARFAAADAKIEGRFASIDQRFEVMRTEAAETKVELLRWMFAFWIGQSATTIGLIFAGVKLLK